jgi:hypothetical protein
MSKIKGKRNRLSAAIASFKKTTHRHDDQHYQTESAVEDVEGVPTNSATLFDKSCENWGLPQFVAFDDDLLVWRFDSDSS